MKKILLFLSFLLMGIGVWGAAATLPVDYKFSNGKSSLPTGVTQSGLGSDYAAAHSPYLLKFDNTGDYLQIQIDASVKQIIFSVKMIGGNSTSTFQIKGSTDNINYSNIGKPFSIYGNQNTIVNCTTNVVINQSYRYFRFVFTKGSNVGFGILKISKASVSTTHTVNWLANNDTIYKKVVLDYSPVDSIPNIDINDYCDDAFIGWTNSMYQNSTPPDVLFTTTKPIITQDTTFYAVFGNYENSNLNLFFKTTLNTLTSEDVFVIVGKKDNTYYAMSNDNGTSKAPDASIVNPINDCISFPNDTILWKLSGNNSDGYTFYPYTDQTIWLYCKTEASSGSNNNLKIGKHGGDSKRKLFILNNDGYLETKDDYTKRYVGVYVGGTPTTKDWRSYTTYHANIANEIFYFYKGVRTIDEYHTNTDCIRKFNNAQNDSLWTTKGNWINNKIPTIKYGARIDAAVIVDTTHAVAKHIIINQNTGNGKIIIKPNKGLEVDSTIVVSKNNSYYPTTLNDLILESSSEGNASLMFNNNNNSQATVYLYSKATYPEGGTANWQYIGTTMSELNALYNYYGSWVYKWNNGWEVVHNGDMMQAWNGYCITQRAATTHETSGQLIPTDTEDKTITIKSPHTVFANSWTAPIHIRKFATEDFNVTDKTIYFFNTGLDPLGNGQVNYGDRTAPGTYVSVPINAATFLDKDSLIPSQQGVFVKTTTDGSITLRYKDLVRSKDDKAIVAGPLRSPKRTMSDNKPNVLKIYAHGSIFGDRLTILEREDFSTGFDNGWDGSKMSLSDVAPSIYVVNEDGSFDEVSAIPNYEGTVLGFKNGSDNVCRLTFNYDGDDTWYLNDLFTLTSTLISDDNEYTFICDNTDGVRFIISATPYSDVSTDIEHNSANSNKPQKYFYNGNLYIIKYNHIFDVVGNLVK